MEYWEQLETTPGSTVKFTKCDDEIYESFRTTFPEIDVRERIIEESLKSKESKEKWRKWVNDWEKKIANFNFGTMLRTIASEEYEQDNTIFGE